MNCGCSGWLGCFLIVAFDLWLGGFWVCFLTLLAHPPSNRSRRWLLLILAWPYTFTRNAVLQRRSWTNKASVAALSQSEPLH